MSEQMTPHCATIQHQSMSGYAQILARLGFRPKRLILVVALLLAAIWPGALGALTRETLVSAYISVSTFVAITLLLFYGAEHAFGVNITQKLRRSGPLQVPFGALMGSLPGCGGAVMVVAAYSSGNLRMGTVVAALTATMGDAAFLLIATRPDAAAVLIPVTFLTGVVSGYVTDLLWKAEVPAMSAESLPPQIGQLRLRDMLFIAFSLAGLGFGIAGLMQAELSERLSQIEAGLALTGLAIIGFIWSRSEIKTLTNAADNPLTRTAEETSFITIWVIGAFLAYEYPVAFTPLDFSALFAATGVYTPLLAILIGFIPGCGPQILVTTFYINGLIPFSALIGNSISNDGDALFPAIALNRKAAIQATLITAIPALFVAYGFSYFLPDLL